MIPSYSLSLLVMWSWSKSALKCVLVASICTQNALRLYHSTVIQALEKHKMHFLFHAFMQESKFQSYWSLDTFQSCSLHLLHDLHHSWTQCLKGTVFTFNLSHWLSASVYSVTSIYFLTQGSLLASTCYFTPLFVSLHLSVHPCFPSMFVWVTFFLATTFIYRGLKVSVTTRQCLRAWNRRVAVEQRTELSQQTTSGWYHTHI